MSHRCRGWELSRLNKNTWYYRQCGNLYIQGNGTALTGRQKRASVLLAQMEAQTVT